jgi:hypothetical protein
MPSWAGDPTKRKHGGIWRRLLRECARKPDLVKGGRSGADGRPGGGAVGDRAALLSGLPGEGYGMVAVWSGWGGAWVSGSGANSRRMRKARTTAASWRVRRRTAADTAGQARRSKANPDSVRFMANRLIAAGQASQCTSLHETVAASGYTSVAVPDVGSASKIRRAVCGYLPSRLYRKPAVTRRRSRGSIVAGDVAHCWRVGHTSLGTRNV